MTHRQQRMAAIRQSMDTGTDQLGRPADENLHGRGARP
jgi:hypothetical protein